MAVQLSAEPVIGYVTGTEYPFNERRRIYVDTRDAIFLLGPEYWIDDQV